MNRWYSRCPGAHGFSDGSAFGRFSRESPEGPAILGAPQAQGDALADVTRDLVRLHEEYYGKGPTKAPTYSVNDTLISILEGGFTTVEETLFWRDVDHA